MYLYKNEFSYLIVDKCWAINFVEMSYWLFWSNRRIFPRFATTKRSNLKNLWSKDKRSCINVKYCRLAINRVQRPLQTNHIHLRASWSTCSPHTHEIVVRRIAILSVKKKYRAFYINMMMAVGPAQSTQVRGSFIKPIDLAFADDDDRPVLCPFELYDHHIGRGIGINNVISTKAVHYVRYFGPLISFSSQEPPWLLFLYTVRYIYVYARQQRARLQDTPFVQAVLIVVQLVKRNPCGQPASFSEKIQIRTAQTNYGF